MSHQKRMIDAVAALAAIVLFFARTLTKKKLVNLEARPRTLSLWCKNEHLFVRKTTQFSFTASVAILFAAVLFTLPQTVLAGDTHTFPAFSTGTITGGGAAYTKSLDVSGLPASEYLMYSVTADYVSGTAPNDAYSSSMQMELNNGGATVFKANSSADMGALGNSSSTTLRWTGVMPRTYTGGGNLTIKFVDTFSDTSGNTYTSSLNNVVVTIYPAPLPIKTFSTFNTGTITGGGTAFTKSLDVTGLPASEYLLYSVTADFVSGSAPNDAYSNSMQMELNNGGATVFKPASSADTGASSTSSASTTLLWTGVMPRTYTGGGNLTIKFADIFSDTSGNTYTSSLNNVVVTIYPAPLPIKTFSTFNTGTITGGEAAYTKSLDVSGLPTSEHLMYSVTADYVPGVSPHDGWSSTLQMELNNGGATVFKPASPANIGVLPGAGATALRWTGVMPHTYTGGANLTIKFADVFTDASGPYTSSLNNVVVTIYLAESVTYTISGNAGAAGATLSYTDGTAKTASADGTGVYSFTVPNNWSGTVTPSKAGLVFSPASRTYTNVTANQIAQDFTTNIAPTDIALSASAINENVTANSTVGTLSSTDPDAGNTFTYTLVTGTGDTDNASFNISGSSLRITNSPDFETKSSYTVRVRTTDQGSLFFDKAFSITINDLIELPDLTINDVSHNEGNAGTTTFTFSVSLSAPAGAGGVTFDIATADNTATAPGDYTAQSLTGQTIPAGSSTYSFSVLVNGDTTFEANETFFVNVTNVTGAVVVDGQGQGAIVNDEPQADLAITKTDGVTSATPGGSVTYTITASNAGPDNATGSTVSDTFPASLTCSWTCVGAGGGTCTAAGSGNINDTANLPSGGSVTYTASCTISAAATGTLSNTATVAAPGGVTDPTPGNNSATDTDTLTPQADLAITKTDGVTTATPGGSVTYTITTSNAGPSNASGSTVSDTFPASLTCSWTCVGAGGGTCTAAGSGNINDTVNLPSGSSSTYTASCTISAAATGTIVNNATVTAPGGVTDPALGNNAATDTDTLTPQADLAITKTDGVTTATPGGSVTYTITASNAGPSNASSATVSDTFPASLTCTWTCVGAGGGTCTAAGSGNINDTVNLPSGGSSTYTASCAISAAATGTLANTATVTAPGGVTDPTPGNNSATDTDTLAAPEINVKGNANTIADGDVTPSLTDHTDFGSVAEASGTVVRTFTIENLGNASLTLSGTPKVAVSGTHAADFTVSAQPTSPVAALGTTTFQVTFDPSDVGTRSATLSINNDDSGENPYDFAIQGIGLNSAPTDIALSASAIDENVAANSTVGTLSSIDPDAGNTFTYSLVTGTGDTDNASFNISGSSLRITSSPNFEAKSSYSVRVRTNDQGSLTFEKAFTITINNVNEAPVNTVLPVISGTNKVGSTLSVTTGTWTDADGDTPTFTYQWKADASVIVGQTLSTCLLTAAQSKKTITCTITADDGNGGTPIITTDGVLIANSAPAFTGTPAITGRAKIKQTLSLADTGTSDADGDTVTLSYQWAAGGVDIPGATLNTYQLTVNEDKKTITCTLTADDGNSGITPYTTFGVNVKSGFPWWSLVPGLIAPKETPWILY